MYLPPYSSPLNPVGNFLWCSLILHRTCFWIFKEESLSKSPIKSEEIIEHNKLRNFQYEAIINQQIYIS